MTRKILFLVFFLSVFLYNSTRRPTRLDWDVFGYYLYLPAQFIYHDIKLEKKENWLNPIIDKYHTTEGFYQAYKGPKNEYVMKYSMGLAIVYSPFFFIADFIAPKLGYERDGFSPPYQYMMMICAMFFSLIGLFYLFKILERYFNSLLVFITVTLIVYGTNYYVMTTYDGMMPHNYVFTFYAIMLYYTIKWYDNQKIKYAVIIGLCMGIAILIRPTSSVVAIIPALWNIGTIDALKERINLFIKNYMHLLLLGVAAFLVILPQLLYWKSVSGHWLYYSYPGEKLDFRHPHIRQVLISYKKGWLLYTPMMCLAITGFLLMLKKQRALFYSIFIFFLINTYIISSWDCWWYGGSFAQRPFVESYVFMAFPLAALMNNISIKKYLISLPIVLCALFFLYLNLIQTQQAMAGIINTTYTTKEYYWKVFLKDNLPEEYKRWLEPSENPDGKDELRTNIKYDTLYNKNYVLKDTSYKLLGNNIFSKPIYPPADLDYEIEDHFLISKIIADTTTLDSTSENNIRLVVCINKKGKLYKYRSKDFSNTVLRNNKGEIQLSVLIPPQVKKNRYEIETYVYYDEKLKVKFKSLNTTIIKRKN